MKLKIIKLLSLIFVVGSLRAGSSEESVAPAAKPNCCQRAEARGQSCRKMCCKDAAKENRVCDHCIKIKPPKVKGRRSGSRAGALPPPSQQGVPWSDGGEESGLPEQQPQGAER